MATPTAPCMVSAASHAPPQVETLTQPHCQMGAKWDLKQSGAEKFLLTGNSSALQQHCDSESRFVLIRNKRLSTPVRRVLDLSSVPERNNPGVVFGIPEVRKTLKRENKRLLRESSKNSSLDLFTTEPSGETKKCAKPTHFFLNRHEAVLLEAGKGSKPQTPAAPWFPLSLVALTLGTPEAQSEKQ